MKRNDTDEFMEVEGEEPVTPRSVRVYEMFNYYRDIPIDVYDESVNDPAYKILMEEITKEIDKHIIELIAKASANT